MVLALFVDLISYQFVVLCFLSDGPLAMFWKVKVFSFQVTHYVVGPMRGCHHQIQSYMSQGFSLDTFPALLDEFCYVFAKSWPPIAIAKDAGFSLA